MSSTGLKIPSKNYSTANRQKNIFSYSEDTTGGYYRTIGYHNSNVYYKPSGYHKAISSERLMVTKRREVRNIRLMVTIHLV